MRASTGAHQASTKENLSGAWLMRYSNSLMNGDLALALGMQGDINGEFTILQAEYTINDNWAIGGQIINITSNDESPLLFFAEDVRLSVTLTYSF